MSTPTTELEQQIEKAYHYRGNVTITLADHSRIEGFLFNREFRNPKLNKDNFVEVFLTGSGERKRLSIATITSVALTGEDHAAGKSYHEWLEKQQARKNV